MSIPVTWYVFLYIFFWEKTYDLMDFGGHWEVLEMYMDIIHIHLFFAHIFVWPGWVLNVLPCTFFFGVYSDIHILPASSNLRCNPRWEMEKLMAQLTCCNY